MVHLSMSDSSEECSVAKKPKLSGEEFAELKKKLKERKKKLLSIPRFTLSLAGENASLSINISNEDRIPIFLSDVQHLLLYSLIGCHSPYLPDRWCKLEKQSKVSHTLVFIVEGLTIDDYVSNEALFKNLTSIFEHKLELITPTAYGGSLVDELAAVPFSTTQKKSLIIEHGSLEKAEKNSGDIIKLFKTIFPLKPVKHTNSTEQIKLPSTDTFSRTDLILSPWQLVEENYPIPIKGGLAKKYADYTLTKDQYTEVNNKSQMFGIDCEMCRTKLGLELTRISIVDEKHNTVYDTLVKPDNKITDYITRYSGITEIMLEDVTTKLADVQKFIRAFLPPDAILIGQSLNADLHALKMMHPYIIDTSVVFNMSGDRYRKTSLKVLAREFLNLKIQKGKLGHCSTEDSLAALQLVQLKLANSISFGDSILTGQCYISSYASHYNKTHYKKSNTIDNISKQEICTLGSPIFNHVSKFDSKTAAIIGCEEIIKDYSRILKDSTLKIMDDQCFDKSDNVRLILTENNKQTVTRCSEIAMEHALNFCHVKVSKDQMSTEEDTRKTITSIDKWIKKLWKHTALYGLVCVIFSGKKNSSNGACFLNLKKNVELDCESS